MGRPRKTAAATLPPAPTTSGQATNAGRHVCWADKAETTSIEDEEVSALAATCSISHVLPVMAAAAANSCTDHADTFQQQQEQAAKACQVSLPNPKAQAIFADTGLTPQSKNPAPLDGPSATSQQNAPAFEHAYAAHSSPHVPYTQKTSNKTRTPDGITFHPPNLKANSSSFTQNQQTSNHHSNPTKTTNTPSLNGANSLYSWADRIRISNSASRFKLASGPQIINDAILEIPDEFLDKNTSKWKRCLVGFFPGINMPFQAVRSMAFHAWKTFDLEDVLSTDNGFFLFRFKHEDSLHMVLEQGPWLFGGKNIVLQQWHPHFIFDKSRISQSSFKKR